jgi:hypothetical protein
MLLNIASAGEVCNWAVTFHFIIIDKTDEGQVRQLAGPPLWPAITNTHPQHTHWKGY